MKSIYGYFTSCLIFSTDILQPSFIIVQEIDIDSVELLAQLVDAVDHLELSGGHGNLYDTGGDQAAVVAVHQPDKLAPGAQTGKYLGLENI